MKKKPGRRGDTKSFKAKEGAGRMRAPIRADEEGEVRRGRRGAGRAERSGASGRDEGRTEGRAGGRPTRGAPSTERRSSRDDRGERSEGRRGERVGSEPRQSPRQAPRHDRAERTPGERNARSYTERVQAREQREIEGSFIWGRRTIQLLARTEPERIKEIFALESLSLESLGLKVPVKRLSRGEFEERFPGETHQGLAARVIEAPNRPLSDLVMADRRGLIVALDEVTDPQNLGALLRVAECSGARGVITTDRRSAPLSPSARKASAGASEVLFIHRTQNIQNAFRELKESGYWIVGTALGAPSLYETELPEKVVVVMGSEGRGLRELTAKRCDLLVSLPILGAVESLNVSTAAAVVLYEITRRKIKKDELSAKGK